MVYIMNFIELAKARFAAFSLLDVLDLLLLGVLFFVLYRFIRRRRAFPILLGVMAFFLLHTVSFYAKLDGLYYLTSSFFKSGVLVVVLAIIFQPEFRAALEKVGAVFISFFSLLSRVFRGKALEKNVAELKTAIMKMSESETGALIILERTTGTDDIVQSGIKIDAMISSELILNIFYKNAPLHDGAMIIRGNRIHAAACFLPINPDRGGMDASFGSRHRAAIDTSRACDAIVIVVSEEDGAISFAEGGELTFGIKEEKLEEILTARFSLLSAKLHRHSSEKPRK